MNKKKILYAEDEYTNRKLMEIKLNSQNISCDLAQDGVTAIELYNKNRYDLVILDQYMPGLNGSEIAKKIRKNNTKIPLIAITSDNEAFEELKMAGFNEIFIKPLRGLNYIEIIKSYL